MKRKIVIVGSTGSIGESTMRVIDNSQDMFEVVAIASSGRKFQRICEQCAEYKPKYLIIEDRSLIDDFKDRLPDVKILHTDIGYDLIAETEKIDVSVIANVGVAGVKPSFTLAKCSSVIAIANKEAIIYGGKIMMNWLKKYNCKPIPIDSEHNSVYQILQKIDKDQLEKITITASGGPLRKYKGDMNDVTLKDALNHPKWNMGYKCTIDSSNLINKGLELIEASILFDLREGSIDCIIHPQVIVHGMVEMIDGSIFAFLSGQDMALHIANAIREDNNTNFITKIDLLKLKKLEFLKINNNRFPGVKLAREALRSSTAHIICLNSADEILVNEFVEGRIKYTDITNTIRHLLSKTKPLEFDSIDDIISYDQEVKAKVIEYIK